MLHKCQMQNLGSTTLESKLQDMMQSDKLESERLTDAICSKSREHHEEEVYWPRASN